MMAGFVGIEQVVSEDLVMDADHLGGAPEPEVSDGGGGGHRNTHDAFRSDHAGSVLFGRVRANHERSGIR
jgi:hypothetical protein